jgi:hypothetical protein
MECNCQPLIALDMRHAKLVQPQRRDAGPSPFVPLAPAHCMTSRRALFRPLRRPPTPSTGLTTAPKQAQCALPTARRPPSGPGVVVLRVVLGEQRIRVSLWATSRTRRRLPALAMPQICRAANLANLLAHCCPSRVSQAGCKGLSLLPSPSATSESLLHSPVLTSLPSP